MGINADHNKEVAAMILSNTPKTAANPQGDSPVCMPKLRTKICERCGQAIDDRGSPCSAVHPSKRFDFVYEDED